MKINIIGGGPAGLYFAILMKKLDARHVITVVERDSANDTFGWGIVFSETTLDNFAQHDAETHKEFVKACEMRDFVLLQNQTLLMAVLEYAEQSPWLRFPLWHRR